MQIKYLRNCKAWLMVIVFLLVGAVSAEARITFLDGKLSITGMFRQQVAYNMGHINTYNSTAPSMGNVQNDKNEINLCRSWLFLEADYRPSDTFRLFVKLRGIYDQTNLVDDKLASYNALHLSPTADYGWAMRAGKDEHITAEVWEMYADIDVGPMFIRVGRQQLVWGEMISSRILDIVNPLDKSWHFVFEPEEYENIRIPLWMARAIYTFEEPLIPGVFEDVYIEGFWNPFDIVPNNMPSLGNPYNTNPSADEDKTWIQDRRGDDEYGCRIGGRIGQVGFTLNYAHLFVDDGIETRTFIPPPPGPLVDTEDYVYYPRIDMYGFSMNYAFDFPISIATSVEVAHYPDKPWQSTDNVIAQFPGLNYKEVKQTDCAIRFQRFCRVFPDMAQMMNVNLQYQIRFVEDHKNLKLVTGPAAGEVPGFESCHMRTERENNDAFALSLIQTWSHGVYKAACTTLWQPDKAYSINPSFTYAPGDNWRIDGSLRWWGGTAMDGETKDWLSYFSYQDEAMLRVSYQF